jgi:hypothetical protein
MQDDQQRKSRTGVETIGLIVGALVLLIALLVWSPWNLQHVASNPGPSGTPGSTEVDRTPPPADSPSGSTTGTAR